MKNQLRNYRTYLALFISFYFLFGAIKIKAENTVSNKQMFTIVSDTKPVPVGGVESITKKIVYPNLAQKLGIQGKVRVNFIVNEDGSLSSLIIEKGLGAGCEEEVINALKSSKFLPATRNGNKIKSTYSLTVNFDLSNEKI